MCGLNVFFQKVKKFLERRRVEIEIVSEREMIKYFRSF